MIRIIDKDNYKYNQMKILIILSEHLVIIFKMIKILFY